MTDATSVPLDEQGTAQFLGLETRDGPLCLVGLNLMEAQLKAARKALTAVGLDPNYVATREAQTEDLKWYVDGEGKGTGVPFAMLATLRAALTIEMDRVTRVQAAQTELLINDAEASRRITQLDRLLSVLDVAQMGMGV